MKPSIEDLTPDQVGRFQTDGYLIIPEYLDKETCTSLLATINDLLANIPLASHPLTKFTTGDSTTSQHVGDEYFLASGDKVRYFFEEAAFSPTGTLLNPAEKSINKIGHALHTQVPTFASISHTGPMGGLNARIAQQLGFKDPRLLQSMVICKQPEIGGAVPPHQDSTFLYTRRPSAVGFWIALEDARKENGCLSFARGSHRRVGVSRRFVRKIKPGGQVEGTEFIDVPKENEDARWPRGITREEVVDETCEEDYELGEVEAGSLVLIHGNLLHKSESNLSQKGRMIYTFHVIDGVEDFDEMNWLQIPGGPEMFTKLEFKN